MIAAGAAAVDLSSRPIPAKESWRDLVVHVEGPFVTPETVRAEPGDATVANPSGLMREGGGVTTLTTAGAHGASVVIDLGRIAMGYVEIGLRSSRGAPIRVSYAEFRQFLSPEGDGMGAPFGTDAHPWSRVDVFDPSNGPTVLHSPGKREARHIAITLDGPGEAVIDFVRVRQTIYPVRYDGYFLCSDELLNRAWYSSAYTGDLATVSEDGSPWMLTVTFDRVLFMGDLHMQALAGYYQSSDYRWLTRNTLNQFGCVQNPDGSLPLASSHLVKGKCGDPGPPDGWRWPDEGPDPDVALGFAGRYSLFHDITIDSFTAFWVASLADYYLYSGDDQFVRPLLPVARRAIGFLSGRSTENGLFYEPEDQRLNPKADIPMVANWEPPDTATGIDSFSNAACYHALRGLALLESDVADRPAAARQLEERAESVRTALIECLWDPDVGAMILNTDDPRRDHTGDANAGNLMFSTLDGKRARAAIGFLDGALSTPFGTRASEYEDNPYRGTKAIYGLLHAVEALGRVRYGDGRGAVELIRRSWGHMLDNGPGTGWFGWDLDGSVHRGDFANSSWVTAIPALSEGVLGIRPTAPGYRRWEIAPQHCGLEWAQGRVPTPGGDISSRWEHTGDSLILSIESPTEGEGEVLVPLLGEPREIAMDGNVVWRQGRPVEGVHADQRADAVAFAGIRGNHTFAWGRA